MKYTLLSVFLIVLVFGVSGCGAAPRASAADASPEPIAVEDQASFMAA